MIALSVAEYSEPVRGIMSEEPITGHFKWKRNVMVLSVAVAR